ncbi:MAG: Nramp family divalent metal transporter [Planctomycetes bacterium]|nr:Nramp family divalent metal transporter [Planctomycetota bacterium]
MKWLKNLGPGFLVTAAFIGPGTVTTASKAGADFGFALVWALAFSVFATVVLQEMCARLGLVSGQGLGESIRTMFANPLARGLAAGLVVAAIAFGNAAFQTGNIVGAAAGLEALTGVDPRAWAAAIGVAAFVVLFGGVYKVLERVLVVLVVLMSVVFLVTAVLVAPDLRRMAAGIVPRAPDGSLITIVALIGTTVVPYNLFLHASAVREKWSESAALEPALRAARGDAVLSISVGGLITLAIMATAAAAFYDTPRSFAAVGDMAEQLGPLFGPSARYFFATGLLAAGLTSAITAPLAAAYATAGVLGWKMNLRSLQMRVVWGTIVIAGTILAATATRPVAAILFAQAANGVLLPLVAIFLLIVMNRRDLLGEHTNGVVANVLGGAVVVTAAGFGAFQLLRTLGAL